MKAVAESMGAKLVVDKVKESDFICNFSLLLAIRFPDTIVVDRKCSVPFMTDELGGAIHELGHLVTTKDVTSPEIEFLGWEFAVAVKYGLVDEWLHSMRDYAVEFNKDFGDLSPDEQSELIEERYYRAIGLGYIVNGEPIKL